MTLSPRDFLAGADRWSAEEKHYFNKGMSAYCKDFILVQKLVRLFTFARPSWQVAIFFSADSERRVTESHFPFQVQTKTVAQCVEFYYTYKKQVKIARNGILTYGPSNSPVDKYTEAVVDIKVEIALLVLFFIYIILIKTFACYQNMHVKSTNGQIVNMNVYDFVSWQINLLTK